MGIFSRNKLKEKPSKLSLDFNDYPAPKAGVSRLVPPSRPFSAQAGISKPHNAQPVRLATRASQLSLNGRKPSPYDRSNIPVLSLQPVVESHEDGHGLGNANRGKRVAGYEALDLSGWSLQGEGTEGQHSSLEEQIRELKANLRNALQRVGETDRITLLNQQLVEEQRLFATQIQSLENQVKDRDSAVEDLLRQVNSSEQNCTEILQQLDRSSSKAAKTREEYETTSQDLRKRLKDKTAAEADLTIRLKESETSRKAKINQVAAGRDQNLLQLSHELSVSKSKLEETRVESQTQIQKLQAKMKQESKEFDVVILAQAQKFRQEIEDARLKSAGVEKKHRGELAVRDVLVKRKNAEVERARARTQGLQLQLQNLQLQKTQLDKRLDNTEAERQIWAANLEALRQDLQTQSLQAEGRIAQAESEKQEVRHAAARTMEDLTKQINDLRVEKEDNAREFQLQIDRLLAQIQEFEEDKERDEVRAQALIGQLQDIQTNASRETDRLRSQLAAIEAERDNRVNALDQELRELNESADEVRLVLNRTRNELSSEKRRASQAAVENEDLTRKYEWVQQQCALLQEEKTVLQLERTTLQDSLRLEIYSKEDYRQTIVNGLRQSIMRILGTGDTSELSEAVGG